MAQPLFRGVPPFCLACMGTDSKFTTRHVMLRWKHICLECEKRNALSFGGDGLMINEEDVDFSCPVNSFN